MVPAKLRAENRELHRALEEAAERFPVLEAEAEARGRQSRDGELSRLRAENARMTAVLKAAELLTDKLASDLPADDDVGNELERLNQAVGAFRAARALMVGGPPSETEYVPEPLDDREYRLATR
jgi:hypothetical protein